MALALEGLEYLVRPPPAKRDRRTSPIPTSPEQRAEAGLNLSVVSIHAVQAYAKRAKQTPHKYELGLITLDEVDRLCQDRLEEEMLQLLPGGENEDVKQLILQKLPAHLFDFADVCSKKESDVLRLIETVTTGSRSKPTRSRCLLARCTR